MCSARATTAAMAAVDFWGALKRKPTQYPGRAGCKEDKRVAILTLQEDLLCLSTCIKQGHGCKSLNYRVAEFNLHD